MKRKDLFVQQAGFPGWRNFWIEPACRDIEAMRRGVGDDRVLGVDANQGRLVSILGRPPAWDLAPATSFAAACADHGIEWQEGPPDSRDCDRRPSRNGKRAPDAALGSARAGRKPT